MRPRHRMILLDSPALAPVGSELVVEVGDGRPFDEAVLSWNADTPEGSSLDFYASARAQGRRTKEYRMGLWTPDDRRQSFKGEKDDDGDVDTDTLRLRHAGDRLRIRVRFGGSTPPVLRRLSVCLTDTQSPAIEREPNRAAWGTVLEVPRRSQMSYPGGNVLCSPTSVSMVLAHWASVLGRPDLDRDVPLVQQGVYDKVWMGTGNWPFNTAFAGSLPGMVGAIARFDDVRTLEEWILAGLPVVTSIAYNPLRGRPPGSNDGHLVVLVGFTAEGDPVFNDPGRSTEVRQVYKREHFLKAWEESNHTVYLIHPRGKVLPEDALGQWSSPATGR
ncbi:MAG: C39 family peptidase [Fimbriimonadaceae bacterium]|nr:C39 family peptidase [Fimbriimonadaceae bacterium]